MRRIPAEPIAVPVTDDMLGNPAAGVLAGPWAPGLAAEESLLEQRRALERFLADIETRALRMVSLSVGDRDAALDIVQDAMIRLVRRYADRPAGEWRPLFYRILSNRITDHQRRQMVRRRIMAWVGAGPDEADPLAELPDTRGLSPDRRLQQDQALGALEAGLAQLPSRQREAFLLRTLEGLDVADTARAMGCSEGSVKTHYFRAVHRLRALLGEHWP